MYLDPIPKNRSKTHAEPEFCKQQANAASCPRACSANPYQANALISKNIPEDVKRTCRAFGYALRLNTTDNWLGFKTILKARLSVSERVSLAFVALKSLGRDDAIETVQSALGGAGQPIPPLFSYLDEASFWADLAPRDEIKAYLLVCYNHLPERDQASFLDFVQKGEAI